MASKLELPVEATKSITGLHASRSLVIILNDNQYSIIEKPSKTGPGTYKRGVAGTTSVTLPPGSLAVHVNVVLNPRGHVKGRFRVYSYDGRLLLEAVMRRRKIRRVRGDASYAWAVERAVQVLGLERHVRRYNWGTGAKGGEHSRA
ncbi:MAG: hypothetical protein GSR74_02050 [Desulfurococcales archaeon]|nr:hypothetical protein [Desulfurococcales archaeon]